MIYYDMVLNFFLLRVSLYVQKNRSDQMVDLHEDRGSITRQVEDESRWNPDCGDKPGTQEEGVVSILINPSVCMSVCLSASISLEPLD